jgi:hypothetical protein
MPDEEPFVAFKLFSISDLDLSTRERISLADLGRWANPKLVMTLDLAGISVPD